MVSNNHYVIEPTCPSLPDGIHQRLLAGQLDQLVILHSCDLVMGTELIFHELNHHYLVHQSHR